MVQVQQTLPFSSRSLYCIRPPAEVEGERRGDAEDGAYVPRVQLLAGQARADRGQDEAGCRLLEGQLRQTPEGERETAEGDAQSHAVKHGEDQGDRGEAGDD